MSDPERLRQPAEVPPCPYVTGRTTRYCTLTPFTLTDAEREAVAWAARLAQSQRDSRDMAGDHAASMRGLLERTK